MKSILSLIILPFKLPKWVNNKILDNSHRFTKHYIRRNYKKYKLNHPIMAESILEHGLMSTELFQNPSPLLTELILLKYTYTPENLYNLTSNTNPLLAKLITSQSDKYCIRCWHSISQNCNSVILN
jgi:hypothetical protein